MRLRSRLQASLPMTFVVYSIEALLALAATLPIGLEAAADQRSFPHSALGHAAWLERARLLSPTLRAQGRSLLLLAVFFVLLSPWLQLAWMEVARSPQRVRTALRSAASLYVRAWQITGWITLVTLLLGGGSWLASRSVLLLPEAAGNSRTEDLAVLITLAPLLLWLPIATLLQDVARCSLASSSSASQALRKATSLLLSPRTLLYGLSLLGAGILLRVFAFWLLRTLPEDAWVHAPLQLVCFAALCLRSAWLSFAVACVERTHTSREPHD